MQPSLRLYGADLAVHDPLLALYTDMDFFRSSLPLHKKLHNYGIAICKCIHILFYSCGFRL